MRIYQLSLSEENLEIAFTRLEKTKQRLSFVSGTLAADASAEIDEALSHLSRASELIGGAIAKEEERDD